MLDYRFSGIERRGAAEANEAIRPAQFTLGKAGDPLHPLRLFEVRGSDLDGIVHSFHTDNGDQANEIAAILREDLSDVEILHHL